VYGTIVDWSALDQDTRTQVVSLASYYQIAGLERAVAEVEEELLEQLFTDTLQKELDEKDETMELFETLSVGTIETDIDTDSIATEEDQEEKEWETYEDLVSEEEVKEWGTNRDLDMTSKAAEAAEETEGEECGNCGCEACRDGQVICSTLELEGKLGCQVSVANCVVAYWGAGYRAQRGQVTRLDSSSTVSVKWVDGSTSQYNVYRTERPDTDPVLCFHCR